MCSFLFHRGNGYEIQNVCQAEISVRPLARYSKQLSVKPEKCLKLEYIDSRLQACHVFQLEAFVNLAHGRLNEKPVLADAVGARLSRF